MENQMKKDMIEPSNARNRFDAAAADTLIEPLDELDIEIQPLDETESTEN